MQLIIDSYGAHVGSRNGMLHVRLKTGEEELFPPRKIRNIIVHRGVNLTSDALMLALKHDIGLMLTDKIGRPLGYLWNGKFGSIATIRRKQLVFSAHKLGKQWALGQIDRKIRAQQAFLWQLGHTFPEQSEEVDKAVNIQSDMLSQINGEGLLDRAGWEARLRGWEGTASRHYFRCLSASLPERYVFKDRSKRPARDPFNCVLNYLYGMLYGIIEMALVRAGIDPHIGVFHADQYNRPVMVFDFIEPYRHWADMVAYRLFIRYAFSDACFETHQQGLWLAPPGKYVAIAAFREYLQETVALKRSSALLKNLDPEAGTELKRRREYHIELEARSLAQTLLNFNG